MSKLFNSSYKVSAEFMPKEIKGRTTYVGVDNYTDYTLCKYVPSADGHYMFDLDGTRLSLYDGRGDDVTDMPLSAGEVYYISVEKSGNVNVTLKTDGMLALAEKYLVKVGNNVFEFTAPASGDYVLDGSGTLTVIDSDYEYVANGNTAYLSASKEYYFVYAASATEDIKLRFTAEKLVNYGTIIAGSGYYELTVAEAADYDISTTTGPNATVLIEVYDEKLTMITHSESGSSSQSLDVGTFFVKISVIDSNIVQISVANSQQSTDVVSCEENKMYAVNTPQNGSVTYQLDRSNAELSAVKLNTNIVIGDFPYIRTVIYRIVNGEKETVELLQDVSTFTCILDSEIYYIEFITTRAKALEFSVGSVQLLGEITVFEKGVEVPECQSQKVLAVGKTYNISASSAAPQLCDVSVTAFSAPSGVVFDPVVSTVTLPADINLAGQKIKMSFSVSKTNEVKEIVFDIVKPYVATAQINNDVFNVTVNDYLGKNIDAKERKIKISYTDGGSFTVLEENLDHCDISALPTVGNVIMRAEVTYFYPAYSETIDIKQDIKSNIIRSDLRNSSTSSTISITVSKDVKSLTVRGTAGKVFSNAIIRISDRPENLVVNLIDLFIANNNSVCISAAGNGIVYLNIYGTVNLSVITGGGHALSANNIVITGMTGADNLYLDGGKNYTNGYLATYAGTGLKATGNVIVKNIKVVANGGDGALVAGTADGWGVYGGDGICAKNLTVESSVITAAGGNGGNGPAGKAGTAGINGSVGGRGGDGDYGGNGGDGGFGIYIDGGSCSVDSASSVDVIGGNGGNGGVGGRGGVGGNSTGNGNVGGRGGDGGRGGVYGKGGLACNISIPARSMQNGVTGYGGQGGIGGNGGSGGNKANGGNGGNGGDSYFYGERVRGGWGGAGGSGGNPGYDGMKGAYSPYNFYTGYNTATYTFVTYNPGTITVKAAMATGNIDITIRDPYGSTVGSGYGSGTVTATFNASPGTKFTIILTPMSYVQYTVKVS